MNRRACSLRASRKAVRPIVARAAAKDITDIQISRPAEIDTFTQSSGYIAAAALEEANELLMYDVRRISAVFKRRPFLLLRRVIQVAWTLGSWAGARYWDFVVGQSDYMFKVFHVLAPSIEA